MSAALRSLAATAALGALLATVGPARADLADDADRLVRMWSLAGVRARRLPPIFAEHGRVHVVTIAGAAAVRWQAAQQGRAAPGEATVSGCLTAAFLAPRTVEFELEADVAPEGESPLERLMRELHAGQAASDEGEVIRSVAGAAMITRCGKSRAELGQVMLLVTSPRAAFDVVVAESAGPPEPIEDILPERAFGPLAPHGDPGRPVEPGPLADRLARAERRARGDGATRVVRVEMRASMEGKGEFVLRLPEGCHRLDIMAEVPNAVPRRATDIDAEVHEVETGRQIDQDRADAPDARLELCVGEVTRLEVPFVGAAGAVRVVLSDACWPIPNAVPGQYGPRARAGFAAALLRRNAPAPREPSLTEAMGVQGDTLVPVAVEPGRCYFAAAALVRGDARSLQLTAEIGDRALRDDAFSRAEGAGVAFCSEGEETAALGVSARGSSPWWALAVWPMD